MGTALSSIVDLFLSNVDDYKLEFIFTTSGSAIFDVYVEPWLMQSINEFSIADQDLTYTPATTSTDGYFDQNLTIKNQLVLANIMTKYWLNKTVNNVRQMENYLQDRDFKMNSAAQNLTAKQNLYNMKREEVSQMLVDYSYNALNWGKWRNQDFIGSV